MHVAGFLSQWLQEHSTITHSARARALSTTVDALLAGGKLSLTHLGRARLGRGHEKHQIKAVDRLLGNPHLNDEHNGIYRSMARSLLSGIKRPVILVDWSDFHLDHE
jgi:hypothetical protein